MSETQVKAAWKASEERVAPMRSYTYQVYAGCWYVADTGSGQEWAYYPGDGFLAYPSEGGEWAGRRQ